ncbi:hypothetical protein R3Q06_29880 [Rhodococcus erythropolis]|uniref:hypothetical protein n=1 Tax=Rhodococcus erythropolis TaxID=1833 RepID=UPI002949903C|nr:hypothetical protein [Rhodococcus erythropolis]MDV6277707.1 hypothetical protein [Rhodococcus erythropolis]
MPGSVDPGMTGVGSAATTSTDLGAETSGPSDLRVWNATDKPIDVTIKKTKGDTVVGELFATALAQHGQAYGRMDDGTVTNTTSMAVCYDHLSYEGK